jgi:hypothetical protein
MNNTNVDFGYGATLNSWALRVVNRAMREFDYPSVNPVSIDLLGAPLMYTGDFKKRTIYISDTPPVAPAGSDICIWINSVTFAVSKSLNWTLYIPGTTNINSMWWTVDDYWSLFSDTYTSGVPINI